MARLLMNMREFKATMNVDANDVTKCLQDYGLHATTVSLLVGSKLMIERTESEGKGDVG